jgi:hypothetical protein
VNEVKKLTDKELASLEDSCSGVAHDWDGRVTITQDSTGVLDFKLFNEEDELEAHFTASWACTFEGANREVKIYAFFDEMTDDPDLAKPKYLELVPRGILGMMGF